LIEFAKETGNYIYILTSIKTRKIV
jgi:hypothetical protein